MRDWHAFVRARVKLPGLRPEREARIVKELASQLEDFYREALACGATADQADAHACRQVRDWERMTQDLWLADRPNARPPLERLADRLDGIPHTRRSWFAMSVDVLRDARYGIRQLGKTPGFAIVAVLTLALGIGATSAIFSVVNGVLLRPLPFPEPDGLVRVFEIVPQYGRFSVAPATFLDWRKQATSFARIGVYNGGSATFASREGPERVTTSSISWDLFELFEVSPMIGRTFTEAEDLPGKNNVIVLSYGMWQRRFGGDPAVLGRTLTLTGEPVTIVGVMPPDFYFPSRETELWRPVALNPASATRGGHFLAVIARLKPERSVAQASAELRTISERLGQQYPDTSANESAEVVQLKEQMVGAIRPALLTLFAAVVVVIVIACANVANLLLVRASVREKEMAIRGALGAGRRRLVLQLLAESLVLAAAGGGLGLLFAYIAIPAVRTLSAGTIPRVNDIAIDGSVLAFSLGVSLLTGIVFGLAPAWHASRPGIGEVLKEGGRSSLASSGRLLRNVVMVAEVALSIVLLVGAALLLRSFGRITGIDPGFRPENVLAFRVTLPAKSYPEPHNRAAFFDSLLAKLGTVSQVRAAGMVQTIPMRGDYLLSFAIQGRPKAKPNAEPSANYRVVSPGYFQTLSIPLKRGRVFTEHDAEKAPMVAVIDEAFARRHFPDEDPTGRGIDIGNGTDGFYQIVGVVGSVRYEGLGSAPEPTMYVPFKQDVFSTMWVLARTDGDPAQQSSAARLAVSAIDPSLPAYSIVTLASVVSDSIAQRRFSMLLLGLFALIALFLAAIGIYGVVAYTVSQRTQEIGVRMAIGAQRGDVLRLIVVGGMRLAAVGVAAGLAGALAAARLVETMLFEVTPFDPASYGATAGILLAVAALACYMPARRAMRVDPLSALRQE
jgi:putative ABC transport system permease protein